MSVKIILLALETLLLFLFLVPLPVICSGNLLGIIVSVILMLITAKEKSAPQKQNAFIRNDLS